MKRSTILLAVALVAVLGLLYFALARDEIAVRTEDADYEASIPVNYEDGSSETVRQFKSASAYYDGKVVESVELSLDVKWRPKDGRENVWILCPRDDPARATTVTVYAQPLGGQLCEVSKTPLGARIGADYAKVETGEWYDLFSDLAVTMTEVADKTVLIKDWNLVWVLETWFAVEEDAKEVHHHRVEFRILMEFLEHTSADPAPTDPSRTGGTPGGGGYDPSAEPARPVELEVKVTPYSPIQVTTSLPWQKGTSSQGGKLSRG